MHNPHDTATSDPILGLPDMPTQRARQRHLRICEESVQRLAVCHRLHLIRKAVTRVGGGQGHNPSQTVVKHRIAKRVAVELSQSVTDPTRSRHGPLPDHNLWP
jgi:hypothetical protein